MANVLLDEIFRLKNRREIDDYASQIASKVKTNEVYFPLYIYLEAVHLYNMYLEALDKDEEIDYLYPYKLRRIIEIGNSQGDKPLFNTINRLYVYNGPIKIKELDGILEILIKYANSNFLLKLLGSVIPLIEAAPMIENLYVALGIMKYKKLQVPKKIGQYYTEDYLSKCSAMPFYAEARKKLKKFIALEQLPNKAKAMYFQLETLYKALESAAIFDFGSLSLQCFKIIEISTKNILSKILGNLSSSDIFEMLPDDLKDKYNVETFKIDRLEIGKIYVLLKKSLYNDDPLSELLKNGFKDKEILEKYISYIVPENVNKYRNAPAHGDYIPQEVADEALKLLDSFINEALFSINRL